MTEEKKKSMIATHNLLDFDGNLGSEPEIKMFESGARKISFNLAHNKSFKKKGESEWTSKSVWMSFESWSETLIDKIDSLELGKGDYVHVLGELDVNSWTDNDGNNKTKNFVNMHAIVKTRKKQQQSED